MPCLAAVRQLIGHRASRHPWHALAWLLLWVLWAPAQAQGVEVLELAAVRDEQAIHLNYQLRVTLPPAVEEAALRGVPLHFAAQATLWRPRWYWRDERIARVDRSWRLSYQPLTSNWRVSQGGLGQSFTSLAEALATMARSSGWRVADPRDVDADGGHYIEFSWRLDTSQLPRPLQIGLGGIGGTGAWALGIERNVKLGP
jgi:Domain of unknown function (DUF4390)